MRVFGPTPKLQTYPNAIQDRLNKSELMGRSAEDQRISDENIKFIEELGLRARRDVDARIILLLLTENVRKDFQIHYLKDEIAKIRIEVCSHLSQQESQVRTLRGISAGLEIEPAEESPDSVDY